MSSLAVQQRCTSHRPATLRRRRARVIPARVVAISTCLLVLLLATSGAVVALATGRQDARSSQAASYVVVTPGDTLWDIAAARAPRGIDIRFAVYQLRVHNKLATANLRVGQRISLPPGWRHD